MSDLILKTENSIIALDFETATPEQVAESIGILANLKAKVKELADNHEAALLAWLQFHGDLTVGDIRYYVGSKSVTRCNDNRQALEAILTACGGDMDNFAQCLASDAFKSGMCRTVLGDDEFGKHFTKMVIGEVKEGKPKRVVLKENTKFTKEMQ